jgi:tetratricopeptide (TPR) repeat protein
MTVDPSKPHTTSLGCLFRIGVAMFAISIPIAVVIFVYVQWEQQKHQDTLAAEIQLIRDRGEPLTSEDLAELYRLPEGVPDITAVYLAALAPLENKELAAELNRLKPLCTLHRAGEEPPHRPAVWDRLAEAEQELLPFQEFLDKVEAAARQTGGVRYPVDFTKGWDADIPQAMLCRSALPALELQTICYFQQGKLDRAADLIIATIRLAESLRFEPLLASQLARKSILHVGCRLTIYVAADPDFTTVDLARIQAALETVEFESIRLPVFLSERAGAHITHTQPAGAERARGWELPAGIVLAKSRPGDCATLLRWQREEVEIAKMPLPQAMAAAKLMRGKFYQECHDSRQLPRWLRNHVATVDFLCPDTKLSWLGNAESENRALIAFCGYERFRRVHQRDPLQLDELVPEFLAAVPADPFTGKPLSLIRWGEGNYAIYSFGEDGSDDNGQGVSEPGNGADVGVRSFLRVRLPESFMQGTSEPE